MPRHHSQMDPDNLTPEHNTAAHDEIGVKRTTEAINKTIIAYDVVLSRPRPSKISVLQHHSDGLIALVNVKINEGWSPIGGLTWDGTRLNQAIVKYG